VRIIASGPEEGPYMVQRAKTRRAPKKKIRAIDATIPNQVFIGCPAKTVRPKYDRVIDKLVKKYPLSFVIVGRREGQHAEDLLAIVKERLGSSSYAIFDATSGNANVSLEFGYAESEEIPRALYLSTHAKATKASRDAAIISDLAGKWQNRYKQEAGLGRLLHDFSREHAYTKRFEKFLASAFRKAAKGKKKRARALALKIVHELDGKRDVRREDVVQALLGAASAYTRTEVDEMIRRLHGSQLIQSVQGPHSRVWIR
jgi:hypothetical protein